MINFKSRLTRKEKLVIQSFINETSDYWGDFYITKDNMRLFIKENISLLFDGLKRGDKIAYNNSGLAIVTGFSDKNPRKYIKFLVKNEKTANDLLRVLSWNLSCDLWVKLKKTNPIILILKRNGFKFYASRGKEELLVRKYIKISSFNKKEKINVKRT